MLCWGNSCTPVNKGPAEWHCALRRSSFAMQACLLRGGIVALCILQWVPHVR